jgi:hypothetical protein
MTHQGEEVERAGQQLDDILSRVKYIGPEPRSTEDEVMDMVVDQIGRTADEDTPDHIRHKTP